MTAYQRRNARAKAEGYKSYYDKRVTEGLKRGLSKTQARGHSKANEPKPSMLKHGKLSKKQVAAIREEYDYDNAAIIAYIHELYDDFDVQIDHETWSELLGSPSVKD